MIKRIRTKEAVLVDSVYGIDWETNVRGVKEIKPTHNANFPGVYINTTFTRTFVPWSNVAFHIEP